MSALDLSTLCHRIGVHPPYFAFSSLEKIDESAVRGIVAPEQPQEFELGALTAAEIGRHTAILGACAAAASRGNEPVHYLATRALYRRLRDCPERATNDPLVATAKVIHAGKRDLKVEACLSDNAPIAELEIEYQIVSEPLFLRMFGKHRKETQPVAKSPYASLVPLSVVSLDHQQATLKPGPIEPSQCAGHFHEFPAWPVALIMHSLCRTAATLLHKLVGPSTHYTITEAIVTADTLTFWSEPISFHAAVDESQTESPRYSFDCQARRGDDLVASLKAIFRVEEPNP